jgi:hypothetical protein
LGCSLLHPKKFTSHATKNHPGRKTEVIFI